MTPAVRLTRLPPPVFSAELPAIWPSQNVYDRWHWARQRRQVEFWAGLIRCQLKAPAACDEFRTVLLQCYRRQRCRDKANLEGGAKGLVDGIVRAGLLKDDSSDWCDIAYRQGTIAMGGQRREYTVLTVWTGRVDVTVEEIPDA